MRFQAGQWVHDDGTPVDTATMLTASQGPGPATVDGEPSTGGDKPVDDPRKARPIKRDPRKNKSAQ